MGRREASSQPALAPTGAPLGTGTRFTDVVWLPEVSSTNAYVAERARQGAAEGLVVVADFQSAGRGRRGRVFLAEPGSALTASVLLRPQLPPDRLHLAVMALSLAGAEACGSFCPGAPGHPGAPGRPGAPGHPGDAAVALKWPNDLLVAGSAPGSGKLGGVLAETDLRIGERPAVTAGIGLNVSASPPGVAGAAHLEQLAAGRVDRAELARRLLTALEARCRLIDEGTPGWRLLLEEYRSRCSTLGQAVRVEQVAGGTAGPGGGPGGSAGTAVEGLAVDVAPDGSLLVFVGGELCRFASAEVYHLSVVRG
ncbi:MAG: biotin--[acetyl-CoA-carboxylase] ligase [Acidimicrobiales bacterium]